MYVNKDLFALFDFRPTPGEEKAHLYKYLLEFDFEKSRSFNPGFIVTLPLAAVD
ncbi:MAG: hypothetical protein PF637_04065 [Spirochaetes bacterium]|nr:hypothetical protein [Spirochaetota bacterium]